MYYAIISEDVANSLPLRMSARSAHIDRLKALAAEDRILLGGPHPALDSEEPGEAGYTGSLIVAQFDSLASAQEWANSDPYIKAGVYAKVVVKPFKRVF
jgi:hypothetical protein